MNQVDIKDSTFLTTKLVLASIFYVLFISSTALLAQAVELNANQKVRKNLIAQTQPQELALTNTKQEHAYEILGRKLSREEKGLYLNLTKDELKNTLLHKEQKLVAVRALIAVGASENIEEILYIMPLTRLRTFTELVTYFTGMKEKYGTVVDGIKAELVYNTQDDEQAFKQAASKAYETTFGIPKDKQDLEGIARFLKAKEAFTYSRMLAELVATMNRDDKRQMLFRALDEIGRPDLKENSKFIEKIIEQDFTYDSLKTLLEQI